MNEPGGVEHSEKNYDNTGGESEIKPVPSATNEKGNNLCNTLVSYGVNEYRS